MGLDEFGVSDKVWLKPESPQLQRLAIELKSYLSKVYIMILSKKITRGPEGPEALTWSP